MKKNKYVCPDLMTLKFTMHEVLAGSPENNSTVIDDGPGWNQNFDDLEDL